MIGKRVAHYEIVEKLGEGGMGIVYRADDTRLGRAAAIKFLPDELSRDRDALERFEREARSASALNHPNVCTVYELGELEGRPFLVMELLEGETLRTRAAGQLPAIGEVLDWAVQISSALEAAHAKGIIHRDVKPANIFVTTGGQAKLMDFGIAKLARQAGAAESAMATLTPRGVAVGTTCYMSPEQARGEEVDARTDLFSFGVVLYELATGTRPFTGDTLAVIFESILTKTPPPPLELRPELPPELGRIIGKALEKDRNLRYQSASDLRRDLLRLQRGESTEQAAAHARTSRLLRPAIAAGALALAAAAGVFFWPRAQAKPLTERDWIVLADFVNNTGDALFDGALKQALSVQLNQSPYLNVVPDGRIEATLRRMGHPAEERLTKPVAREVCEREGVKALLVGSIAAVGSHYSIGLDASNCRTGDTLAQEQVEAVNKDRVLGALGQAASRMRRRLGESLASVQKLDTPIADATTSSLEALKAYSLGWEQQRKGKFRDAMAFYQRAVELDPGFALAYRALGVMHNNAGDWELADQFRSKAFELRQRASARERLFIEADYYFGVQRAQERAADVYRVYAQMYPRDPAAFVNWGIICSNQGQHEKAADLYSEAMRIGDKSSPTYYTNLAAAYRRLNRFAEARALLEQAATKFDTAGNHSALYLLARIDGDPAAMERQVEWFRGKPGEHSIIAAQAAAAAFGGRMENSRGLWRRAIEMAGRAGLNEIQAFYLAGQAEEEALVGYLPAAGQAAARSLKLTRGRSTGPAAARALAVAGSPAPAHALAEELAKRYPEDTLLKNAEIPTVEAAVEIDRGNPRRAVELLESAVYEFGSAACPAVYLRGVAQLRAGAANEAVVAFQKVIDHRGIFTNVTFPLAYLGLGRAQALGGKTAEARQAYQEFFALWENADPGVPVLKEARREFARLKPDAPGSGR